MEKSFAFMNHVHNLVAERSLVKYVLAIILILFLFIDPK